jgi:hypothetical protein
MSDSATGEKVERHTIGTYKDFLKGKDIVAPSKSWINDYMHSELKKLKEAL